MSLFSKRPITLVALCLFALAGFAAAETLQDCSDQTTTGQSFTFSFSPAEQSPGLEDGILTLHIRGDYSISFPTEEFLTWNIEGHCSDVAAPAYGTVIQEYASDDIEWEQSFIIDSACLSAATSDSSVTISLDLSSMVNIYGPSFVCVELTYSSECVPPEAPTSPNPPDGTDEVSIDTEQIAWDFDFPTPCDLGNGGFEDGVFAPWTNVTGPGGEFEPWTIATGGGGWFDGLPFEGTFFAQNGFDGDAGLFYDIYQEITIPADATSAILNWSERIQWDMVPYDATLPREYRVTIQPAGGGPSLATIYSMDLNPGTSGDTGYVPHSVDLLIAAPGIAGQTVRINFHEAIPETLTGPAQFDLDGVEFVCDGSIGIVEQVSPPAAVQGSMAVDRERYDQLRQESLARQNVEPGVRIADESGIVKDGSAPQVTSEFVQIASVGGPDCGGYTFIDSDEPGGPTFDWIEIRGTGTNLNLSDDSHYFPINLPFGFDFYGTIRNQVAVGSNGTVHFVDRYMTFGNQCIPASVSGIDSFIAVYWDDLTPGGGNNVYYRIVGNAPNRILVVQWDNVSHWSSSSSGRVTAQAQLFEGSNNILLLYGDPSNEAGSGGTVGIQRDSGCGLQYLCNQSNLHSGLAILFSRDPCSGQTTTYNVYLGTDPDPNNMELIAEEVCETNCDPTPEPDEMLVECTEYYWQVVKTSPCGVVAGPVWNFKTGRLDGSVCNLPPDCSGAVASVSEIWPPNHKWVDVEILGVTDPEDDPVSITITGITQDEPVTGQGSGTAFPDGDGIGTSIARLRAERSGLGNGRIYEISFEATDTGGAVCNGTVQVCVPHSMGRSSNDSSPGRVCINDGQLFDSTGIELLRADLNGDGIINQLDFIVLAKYWLVSYEFDD